MLQWLVWKKKFPLVVSLSLCPYFSWGGRGSLPLVFFFLLFCNVFSSSLSIFRLCSFWRKKPTHILTLDIGSGTGTYSNPLTFASAPGEFSQCEIIYFPYLKKYLRFEDSCAECSMSPFFLFSPLLSPFFPSLPPPPLLLKYIAFFFLSQNLISRGDCVLQQPISNPASTTSTSGPVRPRSMAGRRKRIAKMP